MKMKNNIIRCLAILLVYILIFSNCDKGKTTDCPRFENSSLSFNYSGYSNGNYFAEGEPVSPICWAYDFAMAGRFNKWIMINANMNGQVIQMFIPDIGTGEFPLPSDYCSGEFDMCPIYVNGEEQFFYITGGKINVTNNQCNRLKGTFFATLKHDIVENGIITDSYLITISDGQFDLKVSYL